MPFEVDSVVASEQPTWIALDCVHRRFAPQIVQKSGSHAEAIPTNTHQDRKSFRRLWAVENHRHCVKCTTILTPENLRFSQAVHRYAVAITRNLAMLDAGDLALVLYWRF